jgi:hypothetical protein
VGYRETLLAGVLRKEQRFMTLTQRIKNAVRAFKGKPITTVALGVDVKKCSECAYKFQASIRDNLLVTAGARAAYMDDANVINLPSGTDGEDELALFLSKVVDQYINYKRFFDEPNFDEFVEKSLQEKYGEDKEPVWRR